MTRAQPVTWRTRIVFPGVAAVLGLFLTAASAPTPIYALYAQRWHFSPTTLTAVFAVYALALLAALLTTGTLSESLGRRPVVLGGLAVQALSMAAFLRADGVGWLYAARILQGTATGVVMSALSAWLLDAEPRQRPGRGSLVNAVAPAIGLAAGALLAGALVEHGPAPLHLTYAVLLAGFLVAAVVVAVLPEPVTERRPVSLAPRVSVAPSLRPTFVATLPCLVATWALGGFFLSLGPSLLLSVRGTTDRLYGALAVVALTGFAAVVSLLVSRQPAERIMVGGSAALAAGVVVALVGIGRDSAGLFLAGSAVAGCGWGPAFLGAFRRLAGLAEPATRGALVASVLVASYLSFSIPAVLGGLSATEFGLRPTAVTYGLVVALLALLAAAGTLVRGRLLDVPESAAEAA